MEKTIHFLKYRYIAISCSWVLIVGFTMVTFLRGGFIMGIDFIGGYKVIASFEDKTVDESKIRKALSDFGTEVQQVGEPVKNEYMISTKLDTSAKENPQGSGSGATPELTKYELLKNALAANFKGVTILSEENVGPAIGDFLKRSAWKLSIMAILMMTVYLAFRFELKYAIGAMIALLHDIAATVAFCGFMRVEFNIPVIAALLTIFGYSVNDTIVIFDRIREMNELKLKETFINTMDKAITQTLSRTILTVVLTLFTVIALFFLGGPVLHDFSLVLLFGFIIGAYSSIFIASPFVLAWERWRVKK